MRNYTEFMENNLIHLFNNIHFFLRKTIEQFVPFIFNFMSIHKK